MKKEIVVIFYFIACIFFGLIFFDSLTASSVIDNRQEALTAYYALLSRIKDLPIEDQCEGLLSFIQRHSELDRACEKLLERFLIYNDLKEAETCFAKLSLNSSCRQNSFRMLARLAEFQKNHQSASLFYKKALSCKEPSISLLQDFARFTVQVDDSGQGVSLLDPSSSSIDNDILQAFQAHLLNRFNRTLEIVASLPDSISRHPYIFQIWGDAHYRMGHLHQADSLWSIGLEMSRQHFDREAESRFLTDFGVLARANRRYEQALAYYQASDSIAQLTGDFQIMHINAGNTGNIDYMLERYQDAENHYQRAIDLAALIHVYHYLAVWYSNAGLAQIQTGNYSEALRSYDSGMKIAGENNLRNSKIRLMIAKGDLFIYLNQNLLAMRLFEQALEKARTCGFDEQEKRARTKLCEILVEEGEYEKARSIYHDYIRSLNTPDRLKERSFWTGLIAATFEKEGRHGLALRYYREAVQYAEEAGSDIYAAWYLMDQARLEMALGVIPEALLKFERIQQFAGEKGQEDLLASLCRNLGDLYLQTDSLKRAISYYKKSARIVEDIRKGLKVEQFRIGYFGKRHQIYQQLIHCYFKRYRESQNRTFLDSLFYYDQMLRSRSMLDIKNREKKREPSASVSPALYRYRSACQHLEQIQHRLRIQTCPDDFNGKEEDYSADFEAARYSLIARRLRLVEGESAIEPRVPSLEQLKRQLKRRDSSLLLYHVDEETAFILVVSGREICLIPLQHSSGWFQSVVDSLINPFHQATEKTMSGMEFRAGAAHRLYQILIKPAEDAVSLKSNLLILPDMALMSLPFEILLKRHPGRNTYLPTDFPNYGDDFLVQDYAMTYYPGLSLLVKKPSPPGNKPGMMVIANPFSSKQIGSGMESCQSSRWRFSPLPYADLEASRIHTIYPRTYLITRDQASESFLKSRISETDILHFATHGFTDLNFDAFSGLVLSLPEDSTEDGLLMGYEISDLSLSSELVVLNGCETGRGRQMAGEGVLGLPRSFLSAGAKTVLMTLWKVDDHCSADLMPNFYAAFLKDKMSKSKALAFAKRSFLSEESSTNRGIFFQHPFYWGSFLLFGEPGIDRKPKALWFLLPIILLLVGFVVWRSRVGNLFF